METRIKRRISLPEIPRDKWCDFRKDYENGMSLAAIGEKYLCDRRTVRTALQYNHSSTELGKRKKPTLLSRYEEQIEKLCVSDDQDAKSLHAISQRITEQLHQAGYHGSERTIRNYLNRQPYITAYMEKQHRKGVEEDD